MPSIATESRASETAGDVAPAIAQAAGEHAHVRTLDGLRFFAFFAVFVFHALQNNRHLGRVAAYGALGVQVFFVLSGFLIGGILLNLKKEPVAPLGARLRIFYIRRALRIFPLYYLTLALLLLLERSGVESVGGSQTLVWNATYLTNLKIFLSQDMIGALSHFWSLAVEEHFYFVAPLVILCTSVRQLSWLCVASWLFAAVGRVAFQLSGYPLGWVLSPLQFDCMTMGVAAAILQAQGHFLGVDASRARRLAIWAGVLCVPLLALWQVHHVAAAVAGNLLDHWCVSLAVSGLILELWNSKSPRLGRLLTLGPFPYLGKISYGLYVFHLPCIVLSATIFSFMPHGNALPALGMTIAVSMLSWHLVEGPINALKKHFPYSAAHAAKAAAPARAFRT
jgi:peptidoglycan/LPS O-acetylase OafA/YrhL